MQRRRQQSDTDDRRKRAGSMRPYRISALASKWLKNQQPRFLGDRMNVRWNSKRILRFAITGVLFLLVSLCGNAQTVSLSLSIGSSTWGQPVTYTATVSESGISGTMTFYASGTEFYSTSFNASQASFTNSEILNPGSYSITAKWTNTGITSNSESLTIYQATPTISISNIPSSAIYGGTFTASYSYSGNGSPTESVTSSTTSVCTVSGSTVSYVGVGTCTLTASATATTDYTAVTGSAQSFTVSGATPTISISNIPSSAIYGGTFTASYSYSGNGSPTESVTSSTTSVCTVSGSTVSYVGVGTCTLTASATATTDRATPTASLSCSPNPVAYVPSGSGTLTACTATINAPGSTANVVFTYNGNSWTTVPLSNSAAAASGFSPGTAAQSFSILASFAGDSNYNAVSASTTFTISKASQSITFPAPSSPVFYSAGPISLSATASSSLGVTFNLLYGPGSVSGSTLTITSTGTIVVAANQAGNANYSAAPQVTQSVVVQSAIMPPAAGEINTVAGSAIRGDSGNGGLATSAELRYPAGVTIDSIGDLYIADQGNNQIREVSALTGDIATIAGGTGSGCAGETDSVEVV
jgi:trimeric autotransporter adhesin